MNVLNYWSFSGRGTRAQWWRFQVWTVLGLAVLIFAAINIPNDWLRVFVIGIAVVAWLLAGIAVSVKRLHDRNKSSWWLLVFYVVPLLCDAAGYYLGNDLAQLITGLGAIINLWALVEFGVLRGTRGPNAYGQDPLA